MISYEIHNLNYLLCILGQVTSSTCVVIVSNVLSAVVYLNITLLFTKSDFSTVAFL
jgi:hypothetical protein